MIRTAMLSTVVLALLPVSARATITMTVSRISDTVADIQVTGDVNATTGDYNIIGTPRPYILTLLHSGPNPLFATLGAAAPYTWNTGATTLMTSNGGVPNTGSHYGTWNGGLGSSSEIKLNIAMSVNPVASSTTITGIMEDVTLPTGFTWEAIGATGTLRNGSANTGNSVATIGAWEIVAAPAAPTPEPSTLALAALGLFSLCAVRPRRKRA